MFMKQITFPLKSAIMVNMDMVADYKLITRTTKAPGTQQLSVSITGKFYGLSTFNSSMTNDTDFMYFHLH